MSTPESVIEAAARIMYDAVYHMLDEQERDAKWDALCEPYLRNARRLAEQGFLPDELPPEPEAPIGQIRVNGDKRAMKVFDGTSARASWLVIDKSGFTGWRTEADVDGWTVIEVPA